MNHCNESHQVVKLSRFYLLDILRGLASLSIIIWHYKNLYVGAGSVMPAIASENQPFYKILAPFYEYGDLAVYLFFILSGFIFFHVYEEPIRKKKVTFKNYFINRFSRLYPLHFVTLIIVAIFQAYRLNVFGAPLIYKYNDFYHFLLNLPMVSAWGFQKAQSFNGPIWSVSVEVFLYLIFFGFCYNLPRKLYYIFACVLFGLITTNFINYYLGIGLYAFFIGGIVFRYNQFLLSFERKEKIIGILLLIQLFLLCTIFYFLSNYLNSRDVALLSCVTFSPGLIVLLAYLQTKQQNLGRSMVLIGDLTYSTYLIHFPIQILMNILFLKFGFFHPENQSTFLFFVIFTYFVSYFVYIYFELRTKNWLRVVLKG